MSQVVASQPQEPASPDAGRASIAARSKAGADGRLLSIQYLRACAALMVVFHHARGQFPDFPAVFNTTAGAAGVDLFFVISGFVMVFVTDSREHSAREFLSSRATRIIPIYWIYSIGCFLLILIAPQLFNANEASARHLILSLLFVPHTIAAEPDMLSPIVKLGWTLNYEVFFYLLFGLAMFVSTTWRVALTASVLTGLILVGVWRQALGIDPLGVISFYSNQMIGEFAIGMLIARAYFANRLDWLGTAPALIMVVLAAVTMVLGAPYIDQARLAVFGLPAAAILIAALALEKRGVIGRYPWALQIGDASYSLYLVQIFPIAVLRTVWRRLDWSVASWPGALLFIAACLVATVLVAMVSYLAVERPSLHWLRRWLGARRQRAAA